MWSEDYEVLLIYFLTVALQQLQQKAPKQSLQGQNELSTMQ